MKVLIVGCGYLGTALGERLAGNNHEVWALRRDEEALKTLAAKGLRPFRADLLKPESLKTLPSFQAAILCQASGEKESYEQIYYQATRNILDALWRQELKKLILISSTSVYGLMDGSWVDEKDDARKAGAADRDAEWLLKTEDLVLSESQGIVFRLGGIYGPGRNRLEALKSGTLKPSFSEVYVNRIHVDDAVSGIHLLLEKGRPKEIYLGVDDCPSTQKEFYEWLCPKLGLKITTDKILKESARVSNKRCLNKKIKELGLKLKYPTFKEGYDQLIADANCFSNPGRTAAKGFRSNPHRLA